MADIFDNLVANLTFNDEEARSNEDLVILNPYASPEVVAIHGVQTGVKMNKKIPILGQLEEIGHADPGGCGANTETAAFAASEKVWTPVTISSRIPICRDDLPQKMKFWSETPTIKARWEEMPDPLKQFILDEVGNAQQRSIIRLADFGDVDADNIAGGGVITAGADATLFTPLNGMWKQIFVDQAGASKAFRYEITENAGASYTAQLALADDVAYQVFKNLVTGISPEGEMGNMVIQCTKSLYDNWVAYMENKSGAYRPEILEDGITKDTFRGKKIVVRKDWDRIIKKYMDNGTTYSLPHRAIYADLNIIPIGTNDTDSLESLDVFYQKKDKKVYIDLAYNLDMKVLVEEYIAVAY